MKLAAALALAVVLAPAALHAQAAFTPSANPVSDSVRQVFARASKNIIAAAELLPTDKYGFRPTPAQWTFGQLMVHIVQTNMVICSAIAGTTPANMEAIGKLSETQPKDALVTAVRQSFDYCGNALANITDARLGDEAMMMGRGMGQSRAMALITIATDWADHYSTAASYLRLNGILPPSAEPPAK